MIILNELVFSDKDLSFTKQPLMVNLDFVIRMRPNRITMTAPTEVDSLIYGDNVPKDHYKTISSTECTTLIFSDGSEIDVAEQMNQIVSVGDDHMKAYEAGRTAGRGEVFRPMWKRIGPDTGQTTLYIEGKSGYIERFGYRINLEDLDKLPHGKF